jgi:hypothetical protein
MKKSLNIHTVINGAGRTKEINLWILEARNKFRKDLSLYELKFKICYILEGVKK